ncbi:cupin domain-containing protein [Streptomyces sp. NPDC048275]|uniref:cupin domain-containing protein n=1 Tax=Streptomyces sp. NPDC048275 TaxID=3155629 RepID=UPI0033E383A6
MTETPDTVRALDLAPHPEGGWYRRLYTSPVTVPHPEHGGPRPSATLIHYLLGPADRSAWHTVASDEIWLWRTGGPLLLRTSPPGPEPTVVTTHFLGPDASGGHALQHLVPAHHWQSAVPASDEEVLVSCLVTPGFDFADFTLLQGPTANDANDATGTGDPKPTGL